MNLQQNYENLVWTINVEVFIMINKDVINILGYCFIVCLEHILGDFIYSKMLKAKIVYLIHWNISTHSNISFIVRIYNQLETQICLS